MGKAWKNPHKLVAAAKKGKIFTKMAKEISIATKLGGDDPDGNPRLKLAINAARAASCPKDTIERAIKRGSGQLDGNLTYDEVAYEGHGPHNVGIIVECQTENRNRTVSEIRLLFKKAGGQLGDQGCVAWMFDRVCMAEGTHENFKGLDLEEEAIEAGANEVESDNENSTATFYGAPEDLDAISKELQTRGWEISASELAYKAKNKADISDEQKNEVIELLEALDDNDDSFRIHSTID